MRESAHGVKEKDQHDRSISYFHAETARARRMCTECKEAIQKGSHCLVGWLLDRCRHRTKGGKMFWCHIRLQMCRRCAQYLPEEYWERYPVEWHHSSYERNLRTCRKKLLKPGRLVDGFVGCERYIPR